MTPRSQSHTHYKADQQPYEENYHYELEPHKRPPILDYTLRYYCASGIVTSSINVLYF